MNKKEIDIWLKDLEKRNMEAAREINQIYPISSKRRYCCYNSNI